MIQAQFRIDPHTEEFSKLRSVCEPGNPWRCVIATMGSLELGKRMSVRLDHETDTCVIGVTDGDTRYERQMTRDEVSFARRYDLGQDMRKPLTVRVDLRDDDWTAKPKRNSGSAKTAANDYGRGTGNKRIKSIRARQLSAIRAAHGTG